MLSQDTKEVFFGASWALLVLAILLFVFGCLCAGESDYQLDQDLHKRKCELNPHYRSTNKEACSK